ncbi:MAG: hypothetical protein H7070_16035 [Saprospiraceae bacterium]|nr:hypothetical protein [Pyrinomonadaceae bacterium]
MSNRTQVSHEILRYLLRHPDAQDTLKGISEWWLLEERLIQKYTEVEEALVKLVSRGFVLAKRTPESGTLYCLNKGKANVIKKIIEGSNNFD